MNRDQLVTLNAARAAKKRVCLARQIGGDASHVIIDGVGPSFLRDEVERAHRIDRSINVEINGERWFLQIFNPPLRLLIVGAVHISQALAPMARLSGYDVTVIDPRRSFASLERFPDTDLIDEWPDDALDMLKPDRRTALVTLTHDPKIDDPALERAIASEAFYIAALGSKRTHAGRIERLNEAGFDAHAIARIHGPAGLDIHAVSPAEIAVSVMAEMTAALRAPQPDE